MKPPTRPRRATSALLVMTTIMAVTILPILLTGCARNGDESPYPTAEISTVTIEEWCPAKSETDIGVNTAVWVRFSGPLDLRTVTTSTILLGSGREHIRGQVRYDAATTSVVYLPYEALTPKYRYEIYATEGLKDLDGRQLFTAYQAISFTTGDPGTIVCPEDPRLPVEGRPEPELDGDTESAETDLSADSP